MPYVDVPSGKFFYRYDGPSDMPLLVLSNSLGTDHTMWEPQIPAFARSFRVLRYDSRGHGASVVLPGPYTIEELGQDVLHLYHARGITRAHFCGLSMGGMVGMWLAAHAPENVDHLVLSNTAARLGPPQLWDTRIESVRLAGMSAIVSTVLGRWFTAAFMHRSPDVIDQMRHALVSTPVEGYIACCEAIRDMDLRTTLSRIQARTLVLAGALDTASTPADARFLSSSIAGAQYLELNAAHMTSIEAAEPFTEAVMRFLSDHADKGMP